jgi:septum formation inhibitor MinC
LNSQEIENIRRTFLIELTELLYKIRIEMEKTRSSLLGESGYPRIDMPTANYHMIQMTEELFLNDLHNKLNEVDQLVALSQEVAQISLQQDNDLRSNPHHHQYQVQQSRERTPNARSLSTGKVMMETPMRSGNRVVAAPPKSL